jgi:hypothetical protein
LNNSAREALVLLAHPICFIILFLISLVPVYSLPIFLVVFLARGFVVVCVVAEVGGFRGGLSRPFFVNASLLDRNFIRALMPGFVPRISGMDTSGDTLQR